eukprot:COSAG05_NODE_1064_length_5991_cov_12.180414_10_plen_41_part_00
MNEWTRGEVVDEEVEGKISVKCAHFQSLLRPHRLRLIPND